MSESTIERKAAKTILQEPIKVVVGRHRFLVPPPTIGTLIAASAALSELPKVDVENENPIAASFRIARDCKPIGEAIAVLLVGARGSMRKGLAYLWWKHKLRKKALFILENLSNSELSELVTRLFTMQEVTHFFGLTTFLIGINMLKPTREVRTTASGQQ